MKTRLLFVPLLIAAVAALAACGGGGSGSVPSDAVAVVNGSPITKTRLDSVISQAEAQGKAQGQPAPKLGTPEYTTLRDKAVAYLVQIAELQQQGAKLGVKVTSADIDAFLKNLAKQPTYGGSMKKLEAAIKKSGLTMQQARFQVLVNLLVTKIKKKVTSTAKVTTAQEQQYYNQNKATYHQAETRKVRHILVSSRSLANRLETKLANGANFATLAKKYSKDTGSAATGGKICAAHGAGTPPTGCEQTVAPFDKAAFSLKTGAISQPVHSSFGWHIIQAVGPIVPAQTKTFQQEQASIKASLLSQQQSTIWGNWVTDLPKKYQGKVSYQTGYAPPPTTTTTPTTT